MDSVEWFTNSCGDVSISYVAPLQKEPKTKIGTTKSIQKGLSDPICEVLKNLPNFN